jgi:hypothetical protein
MRGAGAVAGLTLVVMLVGSAVAQEIGGRYQVQGTNFDGSPYRGTATITLTSDTTCRIAWSVGTTSEGICMRNRNAFSAAYQMSNGRVGLAIYRILDDGTLEGVWTLAGQNGSGREVLVPMR